jgi:subtilase family serine protease
MRRNLTGVLGFCHRCAGVLLTAVFLSLMLTPAADAQFAGGRSPPLVTQPVNDGDRVVLAGNTRPEAIVAANDRGIVANDLPLPHMLLQLRRPAAQEQALVALIDQLHDGNSPNYHHWLTAEEIGERFGPAAADVQAVTGWLSQHGFAVNTVYTNGMVIDFSGSAGQIRAAFHTEIHNLVVDGVAHIANTTDQQVPAALAPVVVGIVSLHDFRPTPTVHHDSSAQPTTFGTDHDVTPGDLATIYNFKPLFAAGLTGSHQRIDLIEDSDLYSVFDWVTFRSAFGIPLANYPHASLDTLHPAPPYPPYSNCTDPGANPSDVEATLDAEYASAAAPDAQIVMEVCEDIGTTNGVLIAIENIVNAYGVSPVTIVSISYSFCEATNGSSMNAAINTAYQTGAAEGMSIYVAAGDSGAAVCERARSANTGIGVNGLASTPYNVAVGGTDFLDTYLGEGSSYWNSTNAADNSSAKSYIPEIPWNNSCGSRLFATFEGYANTYGSAGFCNSSFVANGNTNWLTNLAGSGGPSGCATGAAAVAGVVDGTCAGYPKPSWQSLVGVPNDGVRDLPDVSLFSSTGAGIWSHSYIICFSDAANHGVSPCTTSSSGWSYGWGGTSFATPIWAGIQALINEAQGHREGVPNYRLYQLAAGEYGAAGNSQCASNNGPPSAQASCIFYDVTTGDTDVPCVSDAGIFYNCYIPSGLYGVLSTTGLSYAPAFTAGTGWDFATGIGTVNVANLVRKLGSTATHDFNHDGTSDILWRNTNGDLAIWLMNGTQVLSAPGLGNVPTSWSIVGQRQLNNSGYADLIWRNTNGDLAIWFMNGTQVVSAPGLGNVPTSWSIAGTSAYRATYPDTDAELIWRNTNGDVAIWEMYGTQVLSAPIIGNVPTNWSIVGTGDFSGTGNTDILWRNTNGDLAIWFMNGTQVVSAPGLGNVSTSWSIAGTSAYNAANGYAELIWRNTNGDVAIWEMNGTQVLSAPGLGNVPTNWSIAEIGDFNGDGYSDILWRDTAGNVAIWLMNGTQVVSAPGLGNVSTSWVIQGVNAD